ncbi:hypothetical protein UVI_02048910 [Ustilaginoidea virens]|nr:hypothetical protein UVI_02048910 [Ustilaginoidea virens]
MSIFGGPHGGARRTLLTMVGVTTLLHPPRDAPPTTSPEPAERELDIDKHMHDLVHQVYEDLKQGHAQLSREQLHRFLKQVQAEAVVEPLDQEHYASWEFVRIWLKGYGADAVARPAAKDLSKPLTNYFINSSHNTYLDGNQLASHSTPEAYRNVLLRGCRCIEIDVWNGEPAPSRDRSKSPHGAQLSAAPSRTSQANQAEVAVAALDKSSPESASVSAHSRTTVDEPSPRTSVLHLPDTKQQPTGDRLDAPRLKSGAPLPPRQPRHQSPPRGEPIVTHGHTLTVPCGFREVCEAIKDSAFQNNELPIIISLEVHADWEQQEIMVQIMREVWQDLLVTEPHEDFDPRFRLPKLQDLQRRILVKVKKAPARMEPLGQIVTHSSTEGATQGASQGTLQTASQSGPSLLPTVTDGDDSPPVESEAQPQALAKATSAPPAPAASQEKLNVGRICQSLGDLAVYTRSEHFKAFETKAAKTPAHIFSISEKRILELYQKNQRDLFLHNKNYFMRAYPDKLRFNSSNLDPSLFWRRGVQMAAMNWQKMDAGMMINEGMFADEKGWVLKPLGYQSSDKRAESHNAASPEWTLDLNITMLAGQNIPTQSDDYDQHQRGGSTIRPYVKVELHVERSENATGKEADENTYKKRTDAGKSRNPRFGESSKRHLSFAGIPKVVPELSFVR